MDNMIIKNFNELATTDKKKDCLEILESGLQAANPENIIPKFVTSNEIKTGNKIFNIEKYSSIYSIAFGKAGDSMTRALNAIIPIKSEAMASKANCKRSVITTLYIPPMMI